jgi:hypothetical protein
MLGSGLREALRHEDPPPPSYQRQAPKHQEVPLHRGGMCLLEDGGQVVPTEGQLAETYDQHPPPQPQQRSGTGCGGCFDGRCLSSLRWELRVRDSPLEGRWRLRTLRNCHEGTASHYPAERLLRWARVSGRRQSRHREGVLALSIKVAVPLGVASSSRYCADGLIRQRQVEQEMRQLCQ